MFWGKRLEREKQHDRENDGGEAGYCRLNGYENESRWGRVVI